MSLQNSNSTFSRWINVMFKYRKHSGSWAWILHRITGLGLTAYILMHIIALTGLLKGEAAFNAEMKLFSSPPFLVGEWLLGALVIFHAVNGIRIVLVDLGNGARYHKQILVFVYIISFVMVAGMGYLIFGHL
jgi:succinate dehydrogenase / fumarate reductase, cytochrome b subunit